MISEHKILFFQAMAVLATLPNYGICNDPAVEEMEVDSADPEEKKKEREKKKLSYLDFDGREKRGEVVNRSVLVDPMYGEDGKLESGKLMSIPTDFNPEIHRTPGRPFWNDELDLMILKKRTLDAEIAALSQDSQAMEETMEELKKLGDPQQRAAAAAATRSVANAIKALEGSGVNIKLEDILARLQRAKS